MLTENHKRGDSIALTEGLLIAAQRLSGDELALSVTFGDTSPKGRGLSKAVQKFDLKIKRMIKEKLQLC